MASKPYITTLLAHNQTLLVEVAGLLLKATNPTQRIVYTCFFLSYSHQVFLLQELLSTFVLPTNKFLEFRRESLLKALKLS